MTRSGMSPTAILVSLALALVALWVPMDSARAVSIGGTCAGAAGDACNAGLWCETEAGKCGQADAEGECVRVPRFCTLDFRPVCGCNGRTYGNDCERRRAKVAKAHNGPCGAGARSPQQREPDASQGGR